MPIFCFLFLKLNWYYSCLCSWPLFVSTIRPTWTDVYSQHKCVSCRELLVWIQLFTGMQIWHQLELRITSTLQPFSTVASMSGRWTMPNKKLYGNGAESEHRSSTIQWFWYVSMFIGKKGPTRLLRNELPLRW